MAFLTENREGPVLASQMNSGIIDFQEFSKPLIAAVIRDAECCASENHSVDLQLDIGSHIM